MKKVKIVRITNVEKRNHMRSAVLTHVRKLVGKFDLAAVQAAVKVIYDERSAEKELKEAMAKVESLKKKLG